MATLIVQLLIDGLNIGGFVARPTYFQSGADGYNLNGKAVMPDGTVYQVSGNIIRVDSGKEPEAPARALEAARLKAEKEKLRAEKESARATRQGNGAHPPSAKAEIHEVTEKPAYTPPNLPPPNRGDQPINAGAEAEGVVIKRAKK